MHQGNAVINSIPVPSELRTNDRHIVLESNYPFENSFTYTIESKTVSLSSYAFPLLLKILRWMARNSAAMNLSLKSRRGLAKKFLSDFDTLPYIFQKRPHVLKYCEMRIIGGFLFLSNMKRKSTNMKETESKEGFRIAIMNICRFPIGITPTVIALLLSKIEK